jgi:hypothetical protein
MKVLVVGEAVLAIDDAERSGCWWRGGLLVCDRLLVRLRAVEAQHHGAGECAEQPLVEG